MTPSGTPKPTLMTAPGRSSMAARRAMLLRTLNGKGANSLSGLRDFARERRVVADVVGHPLIGIDDQVIDEDAGHVDQARIEAARRHDAFHLRDGNTARGARGLRHGAVMPRRHLFVHAQVAFFVGHGAADQRHVDGVRAVVEVLLAIAIPQLHDVLDGAGVQLAAFHPRVDERAQADLADQTGAARCRGVEQLHHDAGRQAVGLEQVRGRELRHGGRHGPMAADDAAVEARHGHVLQAARALIADAERVNQGQFARRAAGAVAPADGLQHPLGNGVAGPGAADGHRDSVPNQQRRLVGRQNGLGHAHVHLRRRSRNAWRRSRNSGPVEMAA